MIVSASRRTDIPAYFSDWFMARLRAGYALSVNPMNARQVRRAPLNPDETEAIVFWTKDFGPMMAHLDELDASGIFYYVQFTITPYGRDIEPNLREKSEILATARDLGAAIGPDRLIWRYDPIITGGELTPEWHNRSFTQMADVLAGSVEQVTISFLDIYRKIASSFSEVPRDQRLEIASLISRAAAERGMRVAACCEDDNLKELGVGGARCIDADFIGRATGRSVSRARDRGQRPACGCASSVDIGAYYTCRGGCTYCYAGCARKRSPMQIDTGRDSLIEAIYHESLHFRSLWRANT